MEKWEKTEDQKENLATLSGDMGDLTDEEIPTLQSTEYRVFSTLASNQVKTCQELQGSLTTGSLIS